MKKTLYLLLLLIGASFFTSCNDKKESVDTPPQMEGVWKFALENEQPAILAEMSTPNDSVILDFGTEIQRHHVDVFTDMFKTVVGSFGQDYFSALNWIEFTKGGDVIISYTANDKSELIDKGIIRYYLRNGKIYIGAKPEVLAGLMGGSFDMSKLPGVEMIEGNVTIPLCYRVNGAKSEIYVDKVFMAPLLDMVTGMLPEEILPTATPFITVIKNATTFNLGFKLETTTK